MACTFTIKKGVERGMTPVHIKVRARVPAVDIRQDLSFEVDAYKWNNAHKSTNALSNFRASEYGKQVFGVLDKISEEIDSYLSKKIALTSGNVREIANDIIFAEQRKREREAKEAAEASEAEAKRVTLRKFIDQYLVEIANGARQTDKGMNFSPNTVKAVKQGLTQFKNFCDYKKHDYDFDEIDLQFYHDFTAYLKAELKNKKGEVLKKAYNVNSIGKCIMQLKVVMNVAGSEGFHNNNLWKDKKFKSTRIDVDNVYLTREDLTAIMKADLSKLEPAAVIARDIFLVGCWTAQRVSDYGNLTKDQFDTLTKRWIEDAPDPENPGKTKAEIRTKEITYVKIRQQKTGAKVSIPISSECKAILEKYDYNLPKMPDAELNRLLKKICREAGLNEIVEIVETNGGTPNRVSKKKWELVHTHTARRTGATLMYLSGMDVYDIMKVTGHSSPIMLKKYIKADQLEVIEKITDKYNYFD